MRLKTLLYERQLPDIKYHDWIITYLPTKAWYDKDRLFNFRPSQWQEELLRRIKEKETSSQHMNALELLIKHMGLAWIYLRKDKELLCIDRHWITIQQDISHLLHLDQDQQQQQILQWIAEVPDVVEAQKATPNTTSDIDSIQETQDVSHDELLKQLSAVLDECFILPDDSINELQRRTDELLQLGISVLREQKGIVDIATWSFKSFEDLCQDWHEFIKMAILEWFDENHNTTQEKTTQTSIHSPLSPNINETTTNNNSSPFDEDDDLPF